MRPMLLEQFPEPAGGGVDDAYWGFSGRVLEFTEIEP